MSILIIIIINYKSVSIPLPHLEAVVLIDPWCKYDFSTTQHQGWISGFILRPLNSMLNSTSFHDKSYNINKIDIIFCPIFLCQMCIVKIGITVILH